MTQLVDIEAELARMAALAEAAFTEAMATARTDDSRRVIRAQMDLREATVIQFRVLMGLLNEDFRLDGIATAYAAHLSGLVETLCGLSEDPDGFREAFLVMLVDGPPSRRSIITRVTPVFGGRA